MNGLARVSGDEECCVLRGWRLKFQSQEFVYIYIVKNLERSLFRSLFDARTSIDYQKNMNC